MDGSLPVWILFFKDTHIDAHMNAHKVFAEMNN